MYINISANNSSETLWIKNTLISGKLIIAVYASYVYVCLSDLQIKTLQLLKPQTFFIYGTWIGEDKRSEMQL
jgi:hypothetical protein